MNLREAKNNLSKCVNELDFWKALKELEFAKTQPQSFTYDEERVQGGKSVNILERYVSNIEEIDDNIKRLYSEKLLLDNFIESEVKRINSLEEPHQQVLMLKECGINGKKLTWKDISKMTSYSTRQAQRIYKDNKRDD